METSRPPSCFPRSLPPPPAHALFLRTLVDAAPDADLGMVLTGNLPSRAAEAMAMLMPTLLCGEESAALAFTGFRRVAQAAHARRLWAGIAADERVHEFMLGHVVRALRADALPGAGQARRHARLFFLRLKCADAATHFARISALDCFVTRVLAAMQGRHSLLYGHPPLMRMLSRIRADEGRHVRVTRGYLLEAGMPPALLREERDRVAGQFAAFLSPYFAAFDLLQVDPRRLANCLH